MTDTKKKVIAVLGVYVPLYFLAAWCLWGWLAVAPGGRESRSATVRNLVIVGGVLPGLWFTWWRLSVADRQAATAQRSLQNERYQKGAEMLGSAVLSVRLGGIYALRNLADEHPEQYHVEVMNMLCAFVRHPPEDKTISYSDDDSDRDVADDDDYRQLARSLLRRPDVTTVVETIRERSKDGIALEKKRGFQLNLRIAHLRDSRFEGADLSNAVLDFADLTGADLRGADLRDASLNLTELRGRPKLQGVKNLTQAQLNHVVGHPDRPPRGLDGVCDAQTGKPLVWRPLKLEED